MSDQIPTPDLSASTPVFVSTAEPRQPSPDPAPEPASDPAALAPRSSSAMIVFDQVTKVYEPNIPGLLDVSLQID